jgi:uncharacterized membrane protein YeaQ/YmgE (transglycosylase-associated protein family)
MASLLSWLLTGLIVGFIARAIVPGRQSIGVLMTIVLGVIGAILGGLVSSLIWPTWTGSRSLGLCRRDPRPNSGPPTLLAGLLMKLHL